MDGYFEMTKQEMMSTVYRQLALDYNCQPEDFTRSGILFTEAKMQRGRREMPFITPRLEVITMGKSTVVNASKSVMPYVKQKFRNKSSYEILYRQAGLRRKSLLSSGYRAHKAYRKRRLFLCSAG